MSEKFAIKWRSKVNGRAGRGTRLFGREEAEGLAKELNLEYPDIEHEVQEVAEQAEVAENQLVSKSADEGENGQGGSRATLHVLSPIRG